MITQCAVVLVVIIGGAATLSQPLKANWKYMIVKFNCSSSNLTALRISLRPERIGPGAYGLCGTIELGVPIDDQYKFELNVYRSTAGSSNFVMLPFRMPKIPTSVMAHEYYKPFFMKELKNCSNLPQIEDDERIIEPGTYHLHKCMLKTDRMPTFIRPGFYKVVIKGTGPSLELVAEIVSHVYENIH